MITIKIEGIIVPVPQLNEEKILELTKDEQFYLCFNVDPGICNIITRKDEVLEFYYDELGYTSTSLGCRFMSSVGILKEEIHLVNFYKENNIKYFKFIITDTRDASLILSKVTYFSKLKFEKIDKNW